MKPAVGEARAERPVVGDAAVGGVMSTSPAVLGPLPCMACGQTVRWVRIDDRWVVMQGGEHHECPAWDLKDRFECMSCPVHGDGKTPIDHVATCDDACFDTHPYWHPRRAA